ncbi:cupin domain-containing protein [Paenibacillus durus]|uniref:AraC family ligand binding domain-containing protein n=1 Tax=Paenibacillus durus TaxID=44251 RepID=UPI0004AF5794|nr:AraC family ligand binding domain-containing protein [Paenibacillus durus]
MTTHLHEDIHYPDASFPYAMYTITPQDVTPKGRGFNDLHWHDELQFTLFVDRKIRMRVNGIDHVMESGEAIFINKGALHIAEQLTPNSYYVTFNFPEKLLTFYMKSPSKRHNFGS